MSGERERGDGEITIKEGKSQNIRGGEAWTEWINCCGFGGVK